MDTQSPADVYAVTQFTATEVERRDRERGDRKELHDMVGEMRESLAAITTPTGSGGSPELRNDLAQISEALRALVTASSAQAPAPPAQTGTPAVTPSNKKGVRILAGVALLAFGVALGAMAVSQGSVVMGGLASGASAIGFGSLVR